MQKQRQRISEDLIINNQHKESEKPRKRLRNFDPSGNHINSEDTHTKLKILETTVKSVFLYRCQTWKASQSITRQLQLFINSCLRYILNIYWPKTISNENLLNNSHYTPIGPIGLVTHSRETTHTWKEPPRKKKSGPSCHTWRSIMYLTSLCISLNVCHIITPNRMNPLFF